MFNRDANDNRRVIIVDALHLMYSFAYGATALSTTLMIDGVPRQVDTTLPNYFIKAIHRWSKGGYYPTVICFDGQGCSKSRKAYFLKRDAATGQGGQVAYKSSRESQDGKFYEGVNLTRNLLLQGGVCCLQADGFEADDLIKAAVDLAKVQYPTLPIDVITGDADLIPLVDEQVSVFIRSRKVTWAESKDIEKPHYMQLTPNNYQDYVEDLSAYSKLRVPYNTLLLTKLLRGDKSDDIAGYPKFTPTKYNNLISDIEAFGYDFTNLCRYGNPIATISYRGTEEPIPEELIESTPREQKMIKFSEPTELTELCEVLSHFLDEDIINHVRFVYTGINLNGYFTGLPEGFNRRPAVLNTEIKGYVESLLQQAVSTIQIRLPML